ncbi:Cadmium, zinc and cobalt-transporting ATPase [compost metagenome]
MERIERLEAEKRGTGKIAFVGDGINDTPVLARADVGIAMGGLGSDAAIEAADIVIMTDEPSKIGTAIGIARRTRAIVWQNIVLALGVKGAFLLLGAFGIATMWEAVFSDVGVTVLAVLNSMRALRRVEV